jgi:hypothetical protein
VSFAEASPFLILCEYGDSLGQLAYPHIPKIQMNLLGQASEGSADITHDVVLELSGHDAQQAPKG